MKMELQSEIIWLLKIEGWQILNCLLRNNKRAICVWVAENNQMDSGNYGQQEPNNSKYKFNHSITMPFTNEEPQRKLTSKQEAARDLCIIINSIMKRKFLKTLQLIQFYNFDSIRKGVANDNIQLGYRLAEQNQNKKRRKRTRSLDPYVEYSRSRLLHDIVSKLKARNQGNSWEHDNTTVLFQKVRNLEKLIRNERDNSHQEYDVSHNTSHYAQHNTSSEELRAEILKIKKEMEQQTANQETDKIVADASNITPAQPSANSSAYLDLAEFTHSGNYNTLYKNQNTHQYDYSNTRNAPDSINYERIRQYVSPESINRLSYQPNPNSHTSKEYNSYQFNSTAYRNKPSINYGLASNTADSNANPPKPNLQINNLSSQRNSQPQQQQKSTAEGTTRGNARSKQKIKIISELVYKHKNIQPSQNRNKEVKRSYEIVDPYEQTPLKSKPLRMTSPTVAAIKKQPKPHLCGFCDRCY